MKRYILLALLGLAISFVSCQKTPTVELSVTQDEYTVQVSGGSFTVQVSTNVDLTVSISSGWVHQTGGGGSSYSFSADRNPGYDARTCTITFSDPGSGQSTRVTVSQPQQDAIIPGSLEYKLFYEAQTFSLPVSANIDYSLSVVSGGDWLKSQGTRGLSTKNYDFSVPENTSKASREALIEVTSGSMKQTIKVVQLPTTHKPVTKDDWKESFKITQEIAEQSKSIIEQNPKSQSSGWDSEKISKELLEVGSVLMAIPDRSGKIIHVMQRDSSLVPVILEFDEIDQGVNSSNLEYDGLKYQSRNLIENNDRKKISPVGGAKKALLLAPYLHDNIRIEVDHVKKELQSIGYSKSEVKYFHDSEVTFDHVYGDSLAEYDIIIVNTHGGMWHYEYLKDPKTGEYIVDSEGYLIPTDETHFVLCLGPMEQSDVDAYLNTFDEVKRASLERYIEGGNTCRAIGKKWLEETTSTGTAYPNTLFLVFACHSFEKDDFYDYLTDNSGAEYCGFTSNVLKNETPLLINSIVSTLSKGMSFQDASDYTFEQKSYKAEKIYRAKSREGYTSDEVFLVDPRAYDLTYAVRDDLLTLLWDYNQTNGEYRFDVYLDGKLQKNASQTNKGISVTLPSVGKHKWYVVSNLIEKKKVIASYKSEEKDFEITGPAVAVTGVRVSPATVTIEEGLTYQLSANVLPENASNKDVTWKSNYPEYVTVDETGLITGVKRNGATSVYVTATTVDGGKTSNCRVIVKEKSGGAVAVTGVSLSQSSAELEVGKTLQLKATVSPSHATNQAVQWTSDNNSVVTVSSNGLLTAKGEGTARVTARTADGGYTASATITVKKASEEEQKVPVTGVSINKGSLSLEVGESATLSATISPSNAPEKGLTWTTSMSSVATVTSDGVVTAKAAGTAVITVKTSDGGKTATCNVTVTYTPDPGGEVRVSQVTISPSSANMTVGDTKQFSATISPSNATNQEVSWSSSDPSVASVDSKGLVTAKGEGSATVTVTAKDGGVSSKATVTVSNKVVPVTGVSVSPTSVTMEIGESKALTVTVNPSDATDKTYTVSSDNTSVAEISGNNVVAKGAGTATVTITTTDGARTATCVVTVNKPVKMIAVDPSSLSFGDVNVGETSTKSFTVSNTGKAEVTVSGMGVPEGFKTDAGVPFSVGAGQSKTVNVTFSPTEGKDYSGSVSITSDADSQPAVSLSGKGIEQSSSVTFEAVDLGLSVKWANMNLGATKPEEYGDYFAWGETEPKDKYDWDTYKYCNGTDNSMTKYCLYPSQGYNNFTDGKTVLEPEDDAAYVSLGGKWRMPTDAEWTELRENCTWKWTSKNGIEGNMVTSKNGNSIFLPAAGSMSGTSLEYTGSYCNYWSSTLWENNSTAAWRLISSFTGSVTRYNYVRRYGQSIRPVMDK